MCAAGLCRQLSLFGGLDWTGLGRKQTFIPSCILFASLHSMRNISELPLRAGLIVGLIAAAFLHCVEPCN